MRFTEQLWASFILVFMSLFASSAHGHPPTLRIHAEPTVLDTLVSDRAPVISGNHQSLLDWIYAWIIAAQRGRGGDLKIFMKDAIGRIPLLGFALRNVELVLLKRNWLADKRNFERYMDLIREDDWGYWTLIYAEGTTLDASTLEKSKNYAEKMGWYSQATRRSEAKDCLLEWTEVFLSRHRASAEGLACSLQINVLRISFSPRGHLTLL